VTAELISKAEMKIYVNNVPAEGLKEHASYDPRSMDMDRDDIRLVEPFEVDAFATLAENELVVSVEITCPLRLSCARCLEEFSATIRPNGVFSYSVQPSDVVDITDDVRQEIILAYPMVPICRRACQGLCMSCGQNLNVAQCRHQATVSNS
jgi:uncharacterized protein